MQASRVFIAVAIMIAALTSSTFAESSTKYPKVDAKTLVKVKCFVDQKKVVSSEHFVSFKKARLFFSSEEAVAKYKADPAKFAAYANHQLVLTGQYEIKACPMSGEEPDEFSGEIVVAGVKVPMMCPECAKDMAKEPLKDQITQLFDEEAFKEGQFTLAKAVTKAETTITVEKSAEAAAISEVVK